MGSADVVVVKTDSCVCLFPCAFSSLVGPAYQTMDGGWDRARFFVVVSDIPGGMYIAPQEDCIAEILGLGLCRPSLLSVGQWQCQYIPLM